MKRNNDILKSPEYPPLKYETKAQYDRMLQERDVKVSMRDGIHLIVDIYRPDAKEKFPVLLALAPHNKELQSPEVAKALPPQPPWSPLWMGPIEAGNSEYLVCRGYVHVIGNPRGVGKSEGGGSGEWDGYDLIEWIAKQEWCNGKVGMIGLSAFGMAQFEAAAKKPPHLKAIFPFDPGAAYPPIRDWSPGGVLQVMPYLLENLSVAHMVKGRPDELPAEEEALWKEAMDNPDYKIYAHIYNIIVMRGQIVPRMFHYLVNPFDSEENVKRAEGNFENIKIPTYTGSGWYAYTYKMHLQGAQKWYNAIETKKKLMIAGPAHFERPFHSIHEEIIKWYDYWLKGIENGIMEEPPVKVWVMGANKWKFANDWPIPETKWTKFYLHSWERLRTEPFAALSNEDYDEPDAFLQMPPTHTKKIQKLRYMTDPLAEDILVIGPSALYLYASIDQEDTNWIGILKDLGPDVSVLTGREGESGVPNNLPERELTRGWLKASHRAMDLKRSKPWMPWHPLTRKAWKPVVPGEINEYGIEILSTANLFKAGHRICVEIASLDLPTGVDGLTNIPSVPYHICSSKTTVHKIYHNEKFPSYLLLPIIPNNDSW